MKTIIEPSRRGFITGLLAAVAVPMVSSPPLVRASSLMQIRGEIQPWPRDHRWLALYDIGSDQVMLRADTLIGGPGLMGSPVVDGGFHAPPTPLNCNGLWLPSEKGQRLLDKLHAPALDNLYQSADFHRRINMETGVVSQMNVATGSAADLMQDMSLWKQRGWT